MPNMRTITIEVPDYTYTAQDAATRITVCRDETKELHTRNVECYDSLENQLLTYLRNIFLPLCDVPVHSTLANKPQGCGKAANLSICRSSSPWNVEFKYGLDDTHWIEIDMDVRDGRVRHFGKYDYSKGIGYAYFGVGKTYLNNRSAHMALLVEKWPTIKDILNRWVAQEIRLNTEAFENDLANERRLAAGIANFTLA